MYRPFVYALKIWGTAVLACPVLIAIYFSIADQSSQPFGVLIMLVIFGGIFSLPSMLVLSVAVNLLRNWDAENYQYQKQVLSIICVILTVLPFFLLDNKFPLDLMGFMAVYAAGTVAGVWIYNLHPKEENIDDEVPITH